MLVIVLTSARNSDSPCRDGGTYQEIISSQQPTSHLLTFP
jgi:hypothetical protein